MMVLGSSLILREYCCRKGIKVHGLGVTMQYIVGYGLHEKTNYICMFDIWCKEAKGNKKLSSRIFKILKIYNGARSHASLHGILVYMNKLMYCQIWYKLDIHFERYTHTCTNYNVHQCIYMCTCNKYTYLIWLSV